MVPSEADRNVFSVVLLTTTSCNNSSHEDS